MPDRIEKSMELNAPVSRVWRALTDYRELGVVPRQASGAVRPRPGLTRAYHLARLRTCHMGSAHREDGTPTPLLLHLGPCQVARQSTLFIGLHRRTDHAGRVQPGTDRNRDLAPLDRVRLRQDPADRRDQAYRGNEGGWGPSRCRTSPGMSPKRPSRETAKQRPGAAAPVFAALGDKTRLSLVAKLSGGTASFHLRAHSRNQADPPGNHQAPARTGKRRDRPRRHSGRENRFQLDPAPIEAMKDYLDSVSKQWDQTLARLKAFVED